MVVTHIGAVEEVSDREQRGEDVAQSFVLLQLLHTLLQILQRLCYFLAGGKRTHAHTRTSLVESIKTPKNTRFINLQLYKW